MGRELGHLIESMVGPRLSLYQEFSPELVVELEQLRGIAFDGCRHPGFAAVAIVQRRLDSQPRSAGCHAPEYEFARANAGDDRTTGGGVDCARVVTMMHGRDDRAWIYCAQIVDTFQIAAQKIDNAVTEIPETAAGMHRKREHCYAILRRGSAGGDWASLYRPYRRRAAHRQHRRCGNCLDP